MPGRGPQTFKKRQKEQQRKERQQEKFAKRMERKQQSGSSKLPSEEDVPGVIAETVEQTAEAVEQTD